jgi:trans-aconitate methyltransferase
VVAALTPGSHQLVDWTAPDRYPEIFAAAAAAAPDARRILSFGCSTGEECVSLAQYFPKAEIVGAEINVLSLLKAMKKRSDRIRFVYSSDRILSRLGGFDVVFCMAVLRAPKKQQPRQLSHFELFEERALFLESLVRPGGLLVIHNSMYRFSDTAHRGSYERIPVAAKHDKGVFLPDGVTEVEPDGCLWRKRGA